jgi:hypothetical protein
VDGSPAAEAGSKPESVAIAGSTATIKIQPGPVVHIQPKTGVDAIVYHSVYYAGDTLDDATEPF